MYVYKCMYIYIYIQSQFHVLNALQEWIEVIAGPLFLVVPVNLTYEAAI